VRDAGDLSHAVHADNCQLGPGGCDRWAAPPRQSPACNPRGPPAYAYPTLPYPSIHLLRPLPYRPWHTLPSPTLPTPPYPRGPPAYAYRAVSALLYLSKAEGHFTGGRFPLYLHSALCIPVQS
jgi:hypothetical protein